MPTFFLTLLTEQLAQLEEQRTLNQYVTGSISVSASSKIKLIAMLAFLHLLVLRFVGKLL